MPLRARIRVDHAATRYPVELTLPDVARPGETVGVTVRADGAGAVRLMAVDEGVLALTGYAAPDAFRHFHDNDFGCPFGLYDVYSQVYPDLSPRPAVRRRTWWRGRSSGSATIPTAASSR